ncbi:MAG: hypothetical protein SFX19_06155 [Alphaproteobacteria bacterium]|nr:hypothetical protein [Alphaproteobacteria bacterium]
MPALSELVMKIKSKFLDVNSVGIGLARFADKGVLALTFDTPETATSFVQALRAEKQVVAVQLCEMEGNYPKIGGNGKPILNSSVAIGGV